MQDDPNSDFADEGATESVGHDRRRERPRLRLLVMAGGQVSVRALPESGRLIIGRADDADISIEDLSVSRRHAVLHLEPILAIEDLESRNGTRAGGITLSSAQVCPIRPGDLIELGSVTLTVQRTVAAISPPREGGAGDLQQTDGPPTMQHRPGFVAGDWLTRTWPMLSRIAAGHISVLLRGETGVGKEIVAELIHEHSRRSEAPLVRLNCAAIPETMIESELFGHERGAFTGAHATKTGLLEAAHGGTLFLDEIGDLPATLQAKLLRAIEDGSFRRLGATQARKVDIRFISATHVDLDQAIEEGRFRSDLLYRLNAFTFAIPPLRQRPDEVQTIALTLAAHAALTDEESAPEIAAPAMAALQAHRWPGNIRELRNVIERAVLLADHGVIQLEHLPEELQRVGDPTGAKVARGSEGAEYGLEIPPDLATNPERQRIIAALNQYGGNQTRAAEILGVSRRTLSSRLAKYRIPRPRGGS
jgi:DNA-binding NtrC family response regulator